MSKRKKKTSYSDSSIIEQDERFAFIAGYTSGGFPYGITWEEQERTEQNAIMDAGKCSANQLIDSEDMPDLPF